MFVSLIQMAFYLSAGLALLGILVWYVGSVRDALTGGGDVVIVPFTIAGSQDAKDTGRGAALAKMLQARLQEFEHDLAISQERLMQRASVPVRGGGVSAPSESAPRATITSVVPILFAAQGAGLQTRLLEPAQIKLAVGGVEVGGVIPWLQRLLVNRRTLEFTYYEKDDGVIVSGSLAALGLTGEALRLQVPKATGKAIDLDEVAGTVAAEIVRRRLSRDPSNRVEVLSTSEFRELAAVLNEASDLNRQVTLGRLSRARYVQLLARIEPLTGEVRDWYQLQALAASIAESAGAPAKALAFLGSARDAIQARLKTTDRRSKGELEQQLARITADIASLEPKAALSVRGVETDALRKIEEDARRATDALNQLFHHQLKPLPVELLPAHEANAYSDGKKFYAPPAVAQLPEITWHNMSWQHLNQLVPVFGITDSEANAVVYSYSDVLPVAIRQLGLIESSDPSSWDVYAGAVAWLRAALQGRDFKLGEDKRPLRSLANPGQAYNDPVLGKDPQIANYKDFKPGLEVHAAAGVGGKAFYEAAQRLGVKRAIEIWLAGLQRLPKDGITYRKWGTALLDASGADRQKVLEALRAVGLGSDSENTPRLTPRKQGS